MKKGVKEARKELKEQAASLSGAVEKATLELESQVQRLK